MTWGSLDFPVESGNFSPGLVVVVSAGSVALAPPSDVPAFAAPESVVGVCWLAAFAESALNSPYFSIRHCSVTQSVAVVLSSLQAQKPAATTATGKRYFQFFIIPIPFKME